MFFSKKIKRGLICAIFAIAFFRIALFFMPYKELAEFKNRECSVRVLDKNGEILQILPLSGGLRRENVSIDEIPKSVRNSFIRAEDKRFYFHFGIDFVSAFRALFQNVRGLSRVSGASTITMQLARIVSPSKTRTFSAKLRDCVNAIRIEGKLSKSKILELYLNNVPFGKNAEGIASAARTFYAKTPSELSDAECASLCVIPRSPSRYNPLDNPQNNIEAASRLNPSIPKEKIEKVVRSSKKFEYPFECPHFVRFLEKSGAFKNKREVKLSISLEVQKFAQMRVEKALKEASRSRIANAAVFVCDAKTGDILAWIGSGGWSENDGSQIDGVLNPMQPGSSMKPFLYALALDSGYKVQDVLADVPSEFGAENLYIPQNFNNRFNGAVRFRVALASSLNVPAVKILDKIGEDVYLKKLDELGFDSLKESGKDAGLSLALGGGFVSLRELVRAFAVFVRDGVFWNDKRVFSKDAARLICSILSDKNARAMGFGYAQTFETAYPAIFKTGTSNQYQNITALGATKEYAVGVWMGNFSGNTVIGKTGSSLPARVVREILDFLEDGVGADSLSFPLPENYSLKRICALSGKLPTRFCPEKVYEFVPNDEKIEECTWHNQNGTFYPAEYQRWLFLSGKNDALDYETSALQITSPKDGGIFYFDESKRRVNQIVRIEAMGGHGKSAQIFLDDVLIDEIERPFILNVPAIRGKHSLIIKSDGEEKRASFEVR